MDRVFDISFWYEVLPSVCMLTLPIVVIGGASVLRSFLAAVVIYFLVAVFNIAYVISF